MGRERTAFQCNKTLEKRKENGTFCDPNENKEKKTEKEIYNFVGMGKRIIYSFQFSYTIKLIYLKD